MDRDMAQLADILVDWCGADLDGLSDQGQTRVAREAIRCLAFTLGRDQTARELLARIVRNEMAEVRSRFEEEDR